MNITEYLRQVYEDFDSYITGGEMLCELKEVSFDQNSLPDYGNIHIQQYYLLRYAYGYAFEYFTMYEDLFQKYISCRKISVLSIGCGSGLDAMGLYENAPDTDRILYTGVDLVNWNYKIFKKGTRYIQKEINAWLREQEEIAYDIVFFPKSISEFDNVQLREIAQLISEKNSKKDLYIMISLRATEYTLDKDLTKSGVLVNTFQENGYMFKNGNKAREYTRFTKPDTAIVTLNGRNEYPKEALELCKTLNEYCVTYEMDGANCLECETQRLKRQPILKVGAIKYQIIHLERV